MSVRERKRVYWRSPALQPKRRRLHARSVTPLRMVPTIAPSPDRRSFDRLQKPAIGAVPEAVAVDEEQRRLIRIARRVRQSKALEATLKRCKKKPNFLLGSIGAAHKPDQ